MRCASALPTPQPWRGSSWGAGLLTYRTLQHVVSSMRPPAPTEPSGSVGGRMMPTRRLPSRSTSTSTEWWPPAFWPTATVRTSTQPSGPGVCTGSPHRSPLHRAPIGSASTPSAGQPGLATRSSGARTSQAPDGRSPMTTLDICQEATEIHPPFPALTPVERSTPVMHSRRRLSLLTAPVTASCLGPLRQPSARMHR